MRSLYHLLNMLIENSFENINDKKGMNRSLGFIYQGEPNPSYCEVITQMIKFIDTNPCLQAINSPLLEYEKI